MVDMTVVQGEEPHTVGSRSQVEANTRLTVNAGLVLLVLFAVEVATVIVGPRSVLTPHVVVGLVLVPPLLVKIGSVGWRFLQYYRRNAPFRAQGPPRPLLRALGPVLLLATIVVMASGIALLVSPSSVGGNLKRIHGASFYVWLLLVIAHIALHWRDIRRMAGRDWSRRTRRAVPGAAVRQTTMLISLAVGLLLSLSLVSQVGSYEHKTVYPAVTRHALAPYAGVPDRAGP
jgi:hypothetical protein